MFKYYSSLQELKVYHMINRLKSFSMLLDGDPHGTIRLHNLIHYVAIWVAKGHMYCFKIGVKVEERLKMKELLQKSAVVILLPNDYDNVK